IHAEAGFNGKLKDPLISIGKICSNISLYGLLCLLVKALEVQPWKIYPLQLPEIISKVAQEVHFLKSRSQRPGRFSKRLVLLLITLTKDVQTHESHYLSRTVDIGFQFLSRLILLLRK